jgi:putative ATP-binding cassette transporter
MLSEPHLDLKPGERILIVGEQSVGTCLFRAIAGLWPWGSGRITFPARQSVVFRPTQPLCPTWRFARFDHIPGLIDQRSK